MSFTAAATCTGRAAPIRAAGEKSEHQRSDVRPWHLSEVTPIRTFICLKT